MKFEYESERFALAGFEISFFFVSDSQTLNLSSLQSLKIFKNSLWSESGPTSRTKPKSRKAESCKAVRTKLKSRNAEQRNQLGKAPLKLTSRKAEKRNGEFIWGAAETGRKDETLKI